MAANAIEKAFGVNNIKNHIPLILDFEDHNYDAWRELFLTHCLAFDVLGHIDGTSTPDDDNDAPWMKRDGLVKLWLYGTITQPLFRSTFKPGGTARDIWVRIENQFRNNKEARALQLDHDLRTTEIGDRSVHDYCQTLKTTSDLLANLDAPVSDKNLVMYLLNGLNEKFDNIINVIKHKDPFPSFDNAKTMLLNEETRLKRCQKTPATTDNASAPSVLTVSTAKPQQQQQQQQYPQQQQQRFNRGNRKQNRGRGRGGFSQRPWNNNWNSNWNQQWPLQYYPGPMPHQWPAYPTPWNQQNARGILGSQPPPSPQAHMAVAPLQPTTDFAQAFNTMTIGDPGAANWYMDSGATAHLASSSGMLNSVLKDCTGKMVIVGDGSQIPITSFGSTSIPTNSRSLSLQNVLVAPNIIKNLISVRRFTNDNWCSVEFDPFGFTIKDLSTRRTLLRSESDGELYSLPSHFNKPATAPLALMTDASPSLWHKRLGHVNKASLQSLISSRSILCNKQLSHNVCEACQLGKHLKLPFYESNSTVSSPFELIHSDIWTSPIPIITGIRYYVLFLDHYSHFLWVFPLRKKSEVFSKFIHFTNFVQTQFKCQIKQLQCDNGGEYNNNQFHNFFSSKGIVVRFSCPHTSQQNGRSERMIRTINNTIRTLLFQARLSPSYWVEALHTSVHLLNILPSTSIGNKVPFSVLFNKKPSYNHLKTFGCLCFPNINHSNLHKLAARSSPCLFLGYPTNHKGYRCLDLKTRKIIISRHVVFDETIFPTALPPAEKKDAYNFLDSQSETSPLFKSILESPPAQSIPTVTSAPTEPNIPSVTLAPAPSIPRHPMTTRSRDGTRKQKQVISLLSTSISPIPTSHLKALLDPNWNPSMTDEYDALIKNETFKLVPRPPDTNIIRSMWLYKHKLDAEGKPKRHKSRLVANGKSQEAGLDFDETFSPVVKPVTIRSVLHLALERDWDVHQLDVKNAFLHGRLDKPVYMHQPPGMIDESNPNYVCKLEKALYGLKQAPRAWNARFSEFVAKLDFIKSNSDHSLFVYNKGRDQAFILLYVDDILLTASSSTLRQTVTNLLKQEFEMSDERPLSYFLGIKIERTPKGMMLTQTAYAKELLARMSMQHCKPVSTPVDLKSKLSQEEGDRIHNPTEYRSIAGALQYLTLTRPDIQYAVHQLCLYMHDPRLPHLNALKRVLRYLKGTLDHGLQLHKSTSMTLTSYTDADWAGCPDTRRSTSGYCIFLGDNLLSWSSKRQPTVSRSSAEAEYKGVANVVAETCYIRNLLLELGCPLTTATLVYCDNVSAVYLSNNPVKHQRTKHVEIDIHFVREKVAMGQVRVLHVPSSSQFADIFTKGLPTAIFNEFKNSLSVRSPNASTEGE